MSHPKKVYVPAHECIFMQKAVFNDVEHIQSGSLMIPKTSNVRLPHKLKDTIRHTKMLGLPLVLTSCKTFNGEVALKNGW